MILCCGEALIDMIPVTTDEGAEAFAPHCGGAVFNTAIALGRLGAQAGLLTGMSTDMFGDQLAAALETSHVDATHLIKSDRPSSLAFVRLIDGHATYSFFDNGSAGRMITVDDLPAVSGDISALYFGGISLACEPAADSYAALLAREGAGRAVMMDPNIRPAFIEDEARYRDRLNSMLSRADIVKVSDEDLDWIAPGAGALEDKVATLQDKGPSIVILTRGAEGADGFRRNGEAVHVSAQKAEIVDTVGAGDTFNAGVLAKLSSLGQLHKKTLADLPADALSAALAHGARVAAVTVSRAGANPPWAHEI